MKRNVGVLLCGCWLASISGWCGEIHDAASQGDLVRVKALLTEDGGRLGERDTFGRTPLHVAAEEGHRWVVKYLVRKGADVNATDTAGLRPLDLAKLNAHSKVTVALIDAGATSKATAPSGGTGAAPPGEPAERELTPERKARMERVRVAVERGVAWLLKKQHEGGAFEGRHAGSYPLGTSSLCAYTLLSCGEGRDTPAVRNAFEFMDAVGLSKTYSVALLLLAIDAYHSKEQQQKARDAAWRRDVVTSFRTDGRWAAKAQAAVDWLVSAQLPNGLWTYMHHPELDRVAEIAGRVAGVQLRNQLGDGSNTQFALLGLDAARRLGLDVPAGCFDRALARHCDHYGSTSGTYAPAFPVPAADGSIRRMQETAVSDLVSDVPVEASLPPMSPCGFNYRMRGGERMPNELTMTAAGLSNLVICKTPLEESGGYGRYAARADLLIRNTAAYIAAHFTVRPRRNPYYYLFTLERAGMMCMVERFGGHDWYAEGADAILESQCPDGGWSSRMAPRATGPSETDSTCFALLFLARAVIPPVDVYYSPDDGRLRDAYDSWRKDTIRDVEP